MKHETPSHESEREISNILENLQQKRDESSILLGEVQQQHQTANNLSSEILKKRDEANSLLGDVHQQRQTAKAVSDEIQEKRDQASNLLGEVQQQHQTANNSSNEIRQKRDQAKNLLDEVKQQHKTTNNASNEIRKKRDQADNLLEELRSQHEIVDKLYKDYTSLFKKIENLLPGATTASLASEYELAHNQIKARNYWIGFVVSLFVLLIGYILFLLIPYSPGKPFEWTNLAVSTTASVPLLWIAWYCQRSISQINRIREEYNHKLRIMKLYDGFSKQILQLEDNPETKSQLVNAILETVRKTLLKPWDHQPLLQIF